MDGKSLGIDRFELGSLSGDSQEHFSDLSHAGKTSDLRSQLNTDNVKLVEWRNGVLRSREMCLSDTGVEQSHVGLVTGGQGRTGNGQLSMQGVVLQTWCGENSTHPMSCVAASTRRGTTTDCDVGTKAGIPEDTMWRLLGVFGLAKGEGRAGVEHGRSASGGLRTWLRYVCTTMSEVQFERGSLFPCSLDRALFRLRWRSFRDHCSLAPKKCLLEFTRFSDVGLRFHSFCPS